MSSGIERAMMRAGSQRELAERLNVSQPTIAGWLKQGYTPPIQAYRIWELTGVDVIELVHPCLATYMRRHQHATRQAA